MADHAKAAEQHDHDDVDETPAALVAYFDSPAGLYHACEELRDAGYRNFDAHTPFPVHGLEKAMGLPPSRLPWLVLVCGATGFCCAVLMMWWMGGVDYPMNISGKEPFALQASIPIMFELTVLFSAFGAFFGQWAINRLPMYFHPVMQHPSFHRATADKFFLSVESEDEPKFDRDATKKLLEKLGGHEVEEVMP